MQVYIMYIHIFYTKYTIYVYTKWIDNYFQDYFPLILFQMCRFSSEVQSMDDVVVLHNVGLKVRTNLAVILDIQYSLDRNNV